MNAAGPARLAGASAAGAPDRAADRRPVPLAVRIPVLVLACLLGAVVGVTGTLVHAVMPRVLGIELPAGLALALAAHLGLLVSTGYLMRSRPAILAPALGWLIPVSVFSVPRPEGDLLITSAVVGYTFLLGGALLIGLALAVPYEAPPRRPSSVRRPDAL